MKVNGWLKEQQDAAMSRFRKIVNSTAQVFNSDESERQTDRWEQHRDELADFASTGSGREAFLQELKNRINDAKILQRQCRESHADLCTYSGMEEALEALHNDFLTWMEKD